MMAESPRSAWNYSRIDRPGRPWKQQYLVSRSCTEATWIIKAQNLSRQNIGPDFSAAQEVTALPSRVTVYKQAEQLFGLRHKPITLQDALSRSDSSRDNLSRPDPLSLAETSPLSSSRSRISKPLYKRSRSIDN
ncbi:hypothetical protein V6N12_011826 [Hibiscus sabdariffa]|uniref:Uncharacterized protein n=1 Tax=Hibiscus sabdariffa TaxID=183260 RepID=A0ABR2CGD5_9ROSI